MLKKYLKPILIGVAVLLAMFSQSVLAEGSYCLDTENHAKYMNGTSETEFAPDGYLTRAETAQMLYNLLTEKPPVSKRFSDVAADAWYYDAVNGLYSAGIVHGKYGEDTYCPEDLISRAELVEMLCYFSEEAGAEDIPFTDVPESSPFYPFICTAVSNGWISGYEDNTFQPDNPLSRAEAVTVMNRVLGRTPDADTIQNADDMRLFIDVDRDMWAYCDIMEAAVSHTYQKDAGEQWTDFVRETPNLPAGCQIFNHYLYYIDEATGQFVRNQEVKGYTMDENGRYTTGNAELDGQIHEVVSQLCTNEAGSEENLRKVYDYVRDNFVYQARAHVARGAKGWELEYAVPMMRTHYSNCYGWAAVFMYLARNVGYEAYCQSGAVGVKVEDHGWTEIMFDGEWLIFDPELENANHQHWSFYKLSYNNDFKKYYKYE